MTDFKLGEKSSQLFVFQPDSLVSEHLIDMMIAGNLDGQLLQIVITDLNTKQQQMVLVAWEGASLGDLTYRLYTALGEDDENAGIMETYFWLFWQGWAGVLDPKLVEEWPNADEELVDLARQGKPMRGDGLRKFKSTVVWAFASALTEWGDLDAWKTGELSPGHLKLRNAMSAYIEQRMIALHGVEYDTL